MLVSGNMGFSDCDLMGAFRKSHIVNNYNFDDDVIRNTTSLDFAKRRNNSSSDLNLREEFLSYRREADRVSANDIVGNRRDIAETYDKARTQTKGNGFNR